MIRVAIIEDDVKFADAEEQIMKKSWSQGEELEIHVFHRAEDFPLEESTEYQIIVSDIELPGMNGLELGEQIRSYNFRIYLVYVTNYDAYALQSYQVEAYQYILKFDMETRIPDIMNQLGERIIEERKQYHTMWNEDGAHVVYHRDILYLCKEGKYVRYVTMEGEYRERISLEMATEALEGFPFIKIERGFVINARHLYSIQDDRVGMDNGDELPVSRRLMPQLKKAITLNRRKI